MSWGRSDVVFPLGHHLIKFEGDAFEALQRGRPLLVVVFSRELTNELDMYDQALDRASVDAKIDRPLTDDERVAYQLEHDPGGFSIGQLAKTTGLSKAWLRAWLVRRRRTGSIVSTGTGRACRYYAAAHAPKPKRKRKGKGK